MALNSLLPNLLHTLVLRETLWEFQVSQAKRTMQTSQQNKAHNTLTLARCSIGRNRSIFPEILVIFCFPCCLIEIIFSSNYQRKQQQNVLLGIKYWKSNLLKLIHERYIFVVHIAQRTRIHNSHFQQIAMKKLSWHYVLFVHETKYSFVISIFWWIHK